MNSLRCWCLGILTAVLSVGPVCAVDPPESQCGSAQHPREADNHVAGRTIDQWRDVMKSLELSSPAAAEAVPGLIALCRHPEVPQQTRAQAASTLGRIGAAASSAIPTLTALLTEKNEPPETARWAAKGLALFGTRATPATKALIETAGSGGHSQAARLAAIEALGRIGGAHPDAIPSLMRLADTDDRHEGTFEKNQRQGAAIDSLGLCGAAAGSAVPLLIRLTRDDSADLRMRAAASLGAIGTPAGIATESLVDLILFDEDPMVQDAATTALTRIGEPGQAALAQLLEDEEIAVRRRAAKAFVGMDALSAPSRKALAAALQDSDPDVRLSAVESLRADSHDPDPLLAVLLENLTEPDRQVRIRAYRLLLGMPDQAAAILPQLQTLADDPRPYVRQVARKALDELREAVAEEEDGG